MDPLLQSAILSMLPVAELRGGIPLAIYNGFDPLLALAVGVAANFAIIPVIFLFLDYLHVHFMKIRWYKRVFDHFLEHTRRRMHRHVERYGYWALFFFVAMPLPLFGGYTGTLGAWFFEMERKKALLVIAGGLLLSGIIVTAIVVGGVKALSIFVGAP